MASSGAIVAGRGAVVLGVDSSALEKGLADAKARLQDYGKGILAFGGALAAASASITGPMLAGLGSFAEWGSNIRDVMRQTGMSFTETQRAMDGLRGTPEQIGQAIQHMSRFINEARTGSHAATRALDDMGISLNDLLSASQGQRIDVIANGLARVGANAAGFRDQIFGRRAHGLRLEGGSAGIDDRAAAGQSIRGTRTQADLELASRYTRAYGEMKLALLGLWEAIGSAAAGPMIEFYNFLKNIIIQVRQFVAANREAFSVVFRVADALVTAGAVLGILGAVIVGVGAVMPYLIVPFTVLGSIIQFCIGGFGLLTVASWAWSAVAFAGTMIATGALLVYKVGLLTLTAISWLWSAAGVAMSAVMGLFTASTGAATAGTGAYSLGLMVAWVWENLCTAGILLLVTALGALVIAVGVVVAVLGGFVLFAVAVAYLPEMIDSITDSFDDLWNTVGNSTWFANLSGLFHRIVGNAQTAFAGIKAAFDVGDWSSMWQIFTASVELAWHDISALASGVWDEWVGEFEDITTSITDTLEDAFADAWASLRQLFVIGWGFLEAGWWRVAATIISSLQGPIRVIQRMLDGLAYIQPAAAIAARALRNINLDDLAANANNRANNAVQNGVNRALEIGQQRNLDIAQDADNRAARDLNTQQQRDAQAALDAATNDADRARLQARLDELVQDAQIRAMDTSRWTVPGMPPGGPPGMEGLGRHMPSIGGSVYGDAIRGWLGGAGGGVPERQLAVARNQLRMQERQIEQNAEIIRHLERIARQRGAVFA